GVDFDAVFALNDTLGLGALRALGEAGLRVPEDVAVIGFDNIDDSQYSLPSLSSVDVGSELTPAPAAALLLDRTARTAARRTPRTVKARCRIVRRGSTGGPGADR